jgi:streptogrisin B
MRVLALLIGMIITGVSVAPSAQAAPRAAAFELHAGDPVYSGGNQCTVGAFVTDGSTGSFLTAGFCGQLTAGNWYADAAQTVLVGTTSDVAFPSDDYAIVTLASGVTPVQGFTSAGDASVGQSVCALRSGTGTHCGVVQALNVAVDMRPAGIVFGAIQTTVCLGDIHTSGAPLVSGSTVLGLAVYGDCSFTSGAYFQPITEALAAHGLALL